MLLPSQNVIVPKANHTPHIMPLVHTQIRRYFNKICEHMQYPSHIIICGLKQKHFNRDLYYRL
jgi:hypothetical protein